MILLLYAFILHVRKISKVNYFIVGVVGLYGALFCLIWFDDLTRIILHGFVMGDLLRLSPWSEGLGQQARLTHCGTTFCNYVFQCGVVAVFLYKRENIVTTSCTLYSSLIIVISLQLCGCRQITEPRKYCLVRVIVFLQRVFSLFFFCFSQVGNSV